MADKSTRPVIAVDAMGGDHGPSVVVPGCLAGLTADSPYSLAFYGDAASIDGVLAEHAGGADLPVAVVPCTQEIDMGEAPASAIRNRPDSPIVKAMTDQKQGKVQAVVSAGSTGAQVAASLIILGRLPGVDRPAIATLVPTATREVLLLDAGANVQCTPAQLHCFARMGTVFAREVMGIAAPATGLINIGGEAKKGSELTVAAHALLADAPDLTFHGNVEGNEIMLGPCDVLVTDGFTGNTVLKIVEGFGHFLGGVARRPDLEPEERAAFGPVLGYLQRSFSYEIYGGAMLLGVSGISIIAHGRSTGAAMTNAVRVAWEQIHASLPDKTAAALA